MSDSNPPVFSPTLIPQSCHTHLPSGYTLRPLARNDYAKNFFTCLQSLTTTGDISEAQFLERFDWMRTKGDGWFNNLVIEHEGKIAGTGVVIVEWKFIWSLGKVGHIEDVSILKDYQGKGLGQVLVKALTAVAEAVGCCRVMLDCSKDKEGFYGKCGFVDDGGLHMVHKFEERQ